MKSRSIFSYRFWILHRNLSRSSYFTLPASEVSPACRLAGLGSYCNYAPIARDGQGMVQIQRLNSQDLSKTIHSSRIHVKSFVFRASTRRAGLEISITVIVGIAIRYLISVFLSP
jgi:hypothetical protein